MTYDYLRKLHELRLQRQCADGIYKQHKWLLNMKIACIEVERKRILDNINASFSLSLLI